MPIRIIKNYYNTLNNSGAIENVEVGGKSHLTQKQTARNKLFKTISVICLISLVYVCFVRPKHYDHLKLVREIKKNDVIPPEEFLFKDATIVTDWFDAGEYQHVVDYCERNPKRRVHYEDVMWALSYLHTNDIGSAINKFEKLSLRRDSPYAYYCQYKLAYLYVLNRDVKGLDLLNDIISEGNHAYCKEAINLLNSNLCRKLFAKKGKQGYHHNGQSS